MKFLNSKLSCGPNSSGEGCFRPKLRWQKVAVFCLGRWGFRLKSCSEASFFKKSESLWPTENNNEQDHTLKQRKCLIMKKKKVTWREMTQFLGIWKKQNCGRMKGELWKKQNAWLFVRRNCSELEGVKRVFKKKKGSFLQTHLFFSYNFFIFSSKKNGCYLFFVIQLTVTCFFITL